MNTASMEKIINLCKSRGFIFAGSEIYGGLANSWDYGPLGVELKNNIARSWWKFFVQQRKDIIGLDSGILLNPEVWKASGHASGFSDPLIDCKSCQSRFRADKLIEEYAREKNTGVLAESLSQEESLHYLKTEKIPCPQCKKCEWGNIKNFNLMFQTKQGVTEDSSADIFLRPETAQGIFINFANVLRSSRKKLPFGIAQIGKAFRNEITPGNFIFRTREFEQMEIEYFIKPGDEEKVHKEFEKNLFSFLYDVLKINTKENFRLRWHEKEELSHYSSGTFDIEYHFPFGWSELWGCASRTDFDLKQHEKFSGKDLKYLDPYTNEKYTPYVIEPSFGLNRTLLMVLLDAYHEIKGENGETRTVLKLAPNLAPYTVAVLPLVKAVSPYAEKVFDMLTKDYICDYDESGSIGKRYARQDEIGTPFCITIDYDTCQEGDNPNPKNKDTVTVRMRDSGEQVRVALDSLKSFLNEHC